MKDYRDILTDALKDLDTGTGEDNMKRKGIGEALVALSMVLGDMDGKISKANSNIQETKDRLGELNENIAAFNKNSSKLQKWLIFWTAIIAIATIVALLK